MSKILVLQGGGASPSSACQLLDTLSGLCGFLYDMQMVDVAALVVQPWFDSTCLLALPDGDYKAYVDALYTPQAGAWGAQKQCPAQRIHTYVERGGSLLAIGAGAAALSGGVRFGDMELQQEGAFHLMPIFPGAYWGPVYVLRSGEERPVPVCTMDAAGRCGTPTSLMYARGGGLFVRADAFADYGVDIVAVYADSDGRRLPVDEDPPDAAAALHCTLGRGHVLLFGTRVEMPTPHDDGARVALLSELLVSRLHVNVGTCAQPGLSDPPRLSPVYVAARDASLLAAFRGAFGAQDAKAERPAASLFRAAPDIPAALQHAGVQVLAIVQDTQDAYAVVSASVPAMQALQEACAAAPVDAGGAPEGTDWQRVSKLLVLSDPASACDTVTPYFCLAAYFEARSRARAAIAQRSVPWGMPRVLLPTTELGDLVLYGQVVTSTQTMLEKNMLLLHACKPGTTFFATHQVAGRGRGKNTWISPLGCLQFSTLLHLPAHAGTKTVFLQYLAAMAIVYGLSELLGPACEGIRGRLRIKWPNDVYAEVPETPAAGAAFARRDGETTRHFVKLAGILVNARYERDQFQVVVGCGVNCTNEHPTTSFAALVRSCAEATGAVCPPVTQEQCAGAILAAFETLVLAFVGAQYSFTPFAKAYEAMWMHSNQEVCIAGEQQPVRVVGITSDYGLLRTVPLASDTTASDPRAWSGDFVADCIDLQPDGNSFDMFQNLVKRK
ncbi:hypothetical protein MSPP1_002844 [Malassezia sp. CBS 17886]|nr:hypothetical protein MSPP1_002844 [Malassezia sp. CBS 17886]